MYIVTQAHMLTKLKIEHLYSYAYILSRDLKLKQVPGKIFLVCSKIIQIFIYAIIDFYNNNSKYYGTNKKKVQLRCVPVLACNTLNISNDAEKLIPFCINTT